MCSSDLAMPTEFEFAKKGAIEAEFEDEAISSWYKQRFFDGNTSSWLNVRKGTKHS